MKRVFVAALLLALSGTVARADIATGALHGHLKVISLGGAKLADGDSGTPPILYSEYQLVVKKRDSGEEVAKFNADAEGNYAVVLQPGNYLLDVDRAANPHARARAQEFTLSAGEIVHLDMEIDTGNR